MKIIPNWFEKKLQCTECKTNQSVKWEHKGKPYCNYCILKVIEIKEEE